MSLDTRHSAPRPTPRLPRAERRAQIVRAAATAFVRGGFDGTSMEDVAAEAGVTRLIVYRIFETKEDLYRAVLEGVAERLGDAFGDTFAPREDRREPHIAPALLAIARADPDAFRLFWRHSAHEPRFAEYHHEFRVLADAYADAVIASVVPDDTVRAWAAPALVAHLYDGVMGWLDTGDPARDAEFVALLARGARGLVAAWSAT
jgi:AcrR family transcriptional regulator